MLRLDPWTYVVLAALIVLLPVPWLLAAVAAAAVHEAAHLLAIRLCRGHVLDVRVGPGGAVIEGSLAGERQELFCALAGPMGSLFLLLTCRIAPRLALCGLVQGCFNLLPVYPLDGGRALRCALKLCFPKRGEAVYRWVELAAVLLFLFLIAASRLGWAVKLLALLALCRGLMRKRPCKSRQSRVQ